MLKASYVQVMNILEVMSRGLGGPTAQEEEGKPAAPTMGLGGPSIISLPPHLSDFITEFLLSTLLPQPHWPPGCS